MVTRLPSLHRKGSCLARQLAAVVTSPTKYLGLPARAIMSGYCGLDKRLLVIWERSPHCVQKAMSYVVWPRRNVFLARDGRNDAWAPRREQCSGSAVDSGWCVVASGKKNISEKRLLKDVVVALPVVDQGRHEVSRNSLGRVDDNGRTVSTGDCKRQLGLVRKRRLPFFE